MKSRGKFVVTTAWRTSPILKRPLRIVEDTGL